MYEVVTESQGSLNVTTMLCTCKLFNSMQPRLGQLLGGELSAIFHGASEGRLVNCFILSTETILFSTLQLIVIVNDKILLSDKP